MKKSLKLMLTSLLGLGTSCTILAPSISAFSNKHEEVVASAPIKPADNSKDTTKDNKVNFASDLTLRWQMFLKQAAIDSLLNEIYGSNTQAKEKYIASQEALLHNDYIKQLSTALKYANVITRQSSSYEEPGEYFWMTSRAYPYPVKQADKVIDQANETNWLWTLFNINRFVFMQNSTFTRDNNETESSFSLRDHENKLIYSIFSNIKSNTFTQFVKQMEADSNDVHYYLLNQDGFIIQVDITKEIDDETKEISAKASVFSYIKTFPKLLSASNKDTIFNLNKYVSLFASFDLDNSNKTQTDEVLYKDYYGGILLQYSAIDVK
ncbi:aromatic motif membrane protein [Mycoplasma sp. BRA290]|uniref:aromatic motif membrane protein n=1 Tax=Mycoplasma sp. BRA290 TaxID=3401675 RepID=UPI003AAC3C9E